LLTAASVLSVALDATGNHLQHSGPGHRHIAPEDIMKYDPLLTAVDCTLSTYLLMNRHSKDEEQSARATLKVHFGQLIAQGECEHQRLIVKGLTLLRELDDWKSRGRTSNRSRAIRPNIAAINGTL
jgi:hypothetical protein